MEHLKRYKVLVDLDKNFKEGDQVIGTKFGAGFHDLVIYNESMTKRKKVDFNQVQLIDKDHEKENK